MFLSIDWLSFTFDIKLVQMVLGFDLWSRAAGNLQKQFPLAYLALVKGWDFHPHAGRAPYNSAQQRADNGVMIFAHQRIDNSLVEVGGIGLDALGSLEAELALTRSVASRLTRIDIAVDIFTEVQPDEFTSAREQGHFKAWSETVSKSGHTMYVGSKSSDRYARVYRYFEPHPRHQFLRVEHVLRAEQAKEAAAKIEEVGIEHFVALLGNTFGWRHEVWQPNVDTDEAVKAWRPERRQGKTVAWIYSQVIPAIRKLYNEGALTEADIRDMMERQILDK